MGTRSARLAVLAGLAALVAWGTPAAATTAPVFRPGLHLRAPSLPSSLPPGFLNNLTVAEPSIRVDSGGRMYVIAPDSAPIGCELWEVPSTLASQTFLGAPDGGLGGGDCDLAVSAKPVSGSTFPTVSYSSLSLPNITVGKSTNGGATFTTPNPLATQTLGDDRQWNAAGEGNVVYLSYHILETNNIAVSRSTDGGATYLFRGLAIDTDHIGQALYNNELGPIVVDMHSGLNPKPVYTIFTAPATLTENINTVAGSTQTANHALYLASSYDGGATWRDAPIYVGPDINTTYDHIFPSLGADSGGGLWAAWTSRNGDGTVQHVYATYAKPTNGTQTHVWSVPAQIDQTAGVAKLFPWIVGGGSARADLVWYQGTQPTNEDTSNDWTVRFAQLTRTNGGIASVQAQASDHVIHHGQICTTGVECTFGGDRTLLDFFQVAVTPDGRAAIAWADDSLSAGIGQIYVTVQCGGTSAKTGGGLKSTC